MKATVVSESNKFKSYWFCSKTCLVGLLIPLIFRRKNCTSASAQVQFFQWKIKWINRPRRHPLSRRAKILWKMSIDNKFQAQILTGNPTGNSCCHALSSCALNISCSFGQSAHSIESRCVVKIMDWSQIIDTYYLYQRWSRSLTYIYIYIYASLGLSELTHWGRDKMDAISQTIFSSTFSWMKTFEFRLKFHWSLFLRV